MKEIHAIFGTSRIDLEGDKLTLEAMEGAARQTNEQYIPFIVEHDIRYPPIGRVVSARIIRLPDGEYALQGTVELFEESDSLESLTGDGRRIPVRDQDTQTVAVEYDRAFRDEEGQQLIRELSEVSGEGEKPVEYGKKSLEPIPTLIIYSGVFLLGAVAKGFFSKLGSDVYEKIRDCLIKYYRRKTARGQVLDVCFSAKHDGGVVEVHVLVEDPSEEKLDDLFASRFGSVDSLLLSLPLGESDTARVVLEHKDRRFVMRYAVRSDSVPLMFEGVGGK